MNRKNINNMCKVFILLLSLLSFIFAFNVPVKAENGKFVFGLASATTGKFARGGANLKKAYDFWVDMVNAKGGIEVGGKRYPVELVYYDDKSDPKTTTRLVEKLISEDKVDLIFGPYSSLCVGPSSTITEKYKVPMMESTGNAQSLFERGFKYLFTTLRPAIESAEPYMKLLSKQSPRPETVAIIAPRSPFYLSAAEGFKAYSKKYRFQIVYFETYPVEMEDITPILQEAKAKNAEVLCVGSHTVVAMMVMKQCKQVDFNPKAYCFSFGTLVPEFAKELGKDAEYVLQYHYISRKAPFSGPFLGSANNFIDQFQKKYDIYPDFIQTCAVLGGMAFETAIQRANVTPPLTMEKRVKVRDELAKLDIMTGAGPLRFGPTGFNRANPLCMYQIQGGRPVCVSPEGWADRAFIYPAPKWRER